MTYIFVDTNIFLHFKFFIELPWGKFFGNPYQIVLTPIVVDELDKHKRHPNSKTAARAKQVLSRFEQIVKEPDSFPLKYIAKRPELETFHKFQLDRQEQDDAILATIIEFGNLNPDGKIVFVSNDTGPRFRAASLGIKAEQLPDDFQNPTEISEEQVLIKKLTQENNKLKNAIPKLELSFEGDTTLFKYKLKPHLEIEQDYVTSRYEAMLDEYSPLKFEDPNVKREEINKKLESVTNMFEKLSLMNLSDPLGFNSLSEKQVNTYNKELEDFYKKYKDYLVKKHKFKKMVSLTLPIDIKMLNKGNAPATDIDIWLHFPDGFKLVNSDKFPDKPKKPAPPYKPKNRYDFEQMNYPILPNLNYLNHVGSSVPTIGLSRPDIKQTNSYEVDIHFKGLKHFQSVSIDSMLVVYPNSDQIISFTIDYKIIANNIPEPVTGKLSVVAEIVI